MKKDERDELLIEMRTDIKYIKKELFGDGQEGIVKLVNEHSTYFKVIGVAIVVVPTVVVVLGEIARFIFR